MGEHTLATEILLALQDVSLAYRALPVLHRIDWRVTAGEQWACLGPNGSGKTSLARLFSGQVKRFSGQLARSPVLAERGVAYVCFEEARALCERDRKLDDSEFRADANDPGTTVESLIRRGRAADDEFLHWTRRLGLEAILPRGLRYISTGEMRKALLVRAILERPALLILDSPLDGLDRATQAEMRGVLDELLRSPVTLLVLCRQIEDVPAAVSHVMVLDAGEVVARGRREAVLSDNAVLALMNPPLPALGPLPAPAPRPYALPPAGPLIKMRNVAVSYGEVRVLDGVDWVFGRGTHCCVSGPNGCGKTTLLSLVTGDNHKAYGQDITLFGVRRGSGESVWDIKQKYGQIDTQLHLSFARGMNVLEVVVSGFFDSIGLYDAWGDAQRDRARRWLRALGIEDLERRGFDTLSFGMQRMVLLARAMVKSPIVLVLDEPTLGLDGYHRRLILRAIDHIAAHSDTRIIFVSHSVGELPRCINQHLRFEPREAGFDVVCEERGQTT